MIPEGWTERLLGDLASLSAAPAKKSDGSRYVIVDMGSVAKNGSLLSHKMTDDGEDMLQVGDLVMPKDDIGGGQIIGKAVHIDVPNRYVLGDHVYRLRLSEGHPPYVRYAINSHSVNSSLRSKVVGSAQLGLGRSSVLEQPILFPPLDEQKAIAEAISDADALVESLDALIAKKRDMKQAGMQQLLTGRTRLPGFTDEWQMTLLREVLDFEVGFPFDSGQFHPYEGIRLVRNADLKSDAAVVRIRGAYPANYLVADGDLLIGMDGDFVPVLWKGGEALLNQRVGRVRTTSKSDTSYMSFALLTPLKEIEHMTSATTVKHLSHSDVIGIRVPLPSVDEQKAIAQALSDMDAEIDALVAQREKAELVKQGLMQELLSGRVRLA